nr:Ig-like domain-containing protein [Saccharofermentans sp.]
MVRKFRTKLIASTVAVLSVFNFMMIPVAAAEGEIEVETWAEVLAAVEENNECTIKLTKDIDLSVDDLAIVVDGGKNITLDLNGKTIARDHSARTKNGIVDMDIDDAAPVSYFTLKDSSSDASGKITGVYSDSDRPENTYYTAVIYVGPYAEFVMEGGSITKNTSYDGCGAAVNIDGGKFTMNGGSIDQNNASGYMSMGTRITGTGAGVYIQYNSAHRRLGTFEMNGGVIKDNGKGNYGEADVYYGGGVYVGSNCTFTMNGGTISGNSASQNGGGVYIQTYNGTGANFVLNGGTITDNTGAGIYIPNTNSVLTLGGSDIITVTGNKDASGNDENVYLATNAHIGFNSALKEGSKIGVRSAGTGNDITITSGFNTNNPNAVPKDYFLDDSGNYYIVKHNNEVHYVKCNHTWGEVTYEWSEDYSTCTAVRKCTRNATHIQTETVDSVSEEITPATCAAEGEMKYTATFTNNVFGKTDTTVPTAKLPHTPVHTEAKAATCTEDGNTEYWTCSECGQYFSDEDCTQKIEENSWVLTATGHQNVKNHPAVEAKCESDGNTEYWECTDCGKFFSDSACTNVIEEGSWVTTATGHQNVKNHPAEEAKCESDGNTEYWECTDCGKFFSDAACTNAIEEGSWVTKATGHKNVTNHPATEAKCETAGNTEYWECTDCGKYFSDAECTNAINEGSWVLDATGHKNVTAHAAAAATCDKAGNTAYWECEDCGKYFSDEECTNAIEKDSWIIDAAHTGMKAHKASSATCTEDGNNAYWECTDCGKYFSDAEGKNVIDKDSWIVKATGHDWSDWKVTKAATVDAEGEETRTCSKCGTSETKTTPKLTPDPVSLKLDKSSVNILCGKTDTIKAVVKGTKDKVTWKSSNTKIATVDANGKVTAKMAGSVTITATVAGKKATCKVQILYKDVTDTNDFWYTPTYYLTNKGVVKGYANQTEFRPANICTRAQMVTFIWRLQGEPAPKTKTCKFDDVKEKDYF